MLKKLFQTKQPDQERASIVKQAFSVPDMHCSSCVMLLESIEDELQGVAKISASCKAKRMEVEYDPSAVAITDIVDAAKKEGYEAIPLEDNK